MAITAQEVNKLRQLTGAGMMDCKKALTETNADFDEAVALLRKKGQKISAKRADKEATEGVVFFRQSSDQKFGVVLSLNCETDFVAKNEEFISLGNAMVDTAMEAKPASKDELFNAQYNGRSFGEHVTDLMGKIGERIELSSMESLESECVVPYLHSNSKLGVLVGLNGTNGENVEEVGKDIAMQIAAMNPVALDKDGVDSTIIEKEVEIGKEQAREEGKPEAMLEKIAMGKLNKFFKENTLLNQQFVKDPSKTISQLLEGTVKGMTVSEFKRVSIA
ncbi:MAG: translation elongation factor Ts [Cyclobacteriaceae bacterium]